MTISFFVEGEPVPCARPRVVGRHAYMPKSTVVWQKHVYWTAKQFQPPGLLIGPLKVSIDFYFKKPKSVKNSIFCIGRGDIDNYVKSILDPLHGVIFKNDNQVVKLNATKIYGVRIGVEILVEHIDEQ